MKNENYFVDIHSHLLNTEPEVLQILNDDTFLEPAFSMNQDQFYISGYHPYLLKHEIDPKSVKQHILNNRNKMVGIGEIGIDFSIPAEYSLQEEVFVQFSQLALEQNLPIFIHSVRAYSQIIGILKKLNFPTPIILHDFRGKEQELKQILKCPLNFYFSLSAKFLKKNNAKNLFSLIPQEKCFLESDNTGINIKQIYQSFSNHFQIPIESLRYQYAKNFNTLFPHLPSSSIA